MITHDPVNILLVDDTPGKLLSYEAILADLGENLIKVSSAKEALSELLRTEIAVILTDVCMPDLDGFEFAEILRQHPRYEHTAIIFISAVHLSDLDYVRGYNSGAVDYVAVPVVPEILRAKVKIFVELFRKTKQLEALNNDLEARVLERTEELERSGARLRESDDRFVLASRAAGFGSYEYDIGKDRFHWSSLVKPLVDAGVEGPSSLQSLLAMVHEDDRNAVKTAMHPETANVGGRSDLEFRALLPDGKVRWILNRSQVLPAGDNDAAVRVCGTMLDITERKSAEAHQGLLLAELDHRVKNILANVTAIAGLSSKHATSVDGYLKALNGRIEAMATAHDLLRKANWKGVDLHGLAHASLHPFGTNEGNIHIEGTSVLLTPKAAQSVALAFHELATNALKYGALSRPQGAVTISCSKDLGSTPAKIKLTWREQGGPAVSPPGHSGFGMKALRAAAYEASARADIAFDVEGVVYTLEGPLMVTDEFSSDSVANTESSNAEGIPARASAHSDGNQYRILIVEDEPLLAISLQALLEEEGHAVVGPAMDLARGFELVRGDHFDLALLDIRLGNVTSLPLAQELVSRGIPFAFVTGYSETSAVPSSLTSMHRVQKPYGPEDIRHAIDTITTPPAAERAMA